MKLNMDVSLGPGHIVMGTQLPLPKWGTAPNFRFMSVVAKRLDELRMPLGMEVELGPGNIVLDEDPAFPLKRGHGTSSNCGPCIVAKRLH